MMESNASSLRSNHDEKQNVNLLKTCANDLEDSRPRHQDILSLIQSQAIMMSISHEVDREGITGSTLTPAASFTEWQTGDSETLCWYEHRILWNFQCKRVLVKLIIKIVHTSKEILNSTFYAEIPYFSQHYFFQQPSAFSDFFQKGPNKPMELLRIWRGGCCVWVFTET